MVSYLVNNRLIKLELIRREREGGGEREGLIGKISNDVTLERYGRFEKI